MNSKLRFQVSNVMNVNISSLDFEMSVKDSSIINVNPIPSDDSCIGVLLNELSDIKMNHSDKDKVFRILIEITKQTCKISSSLIEENNGMNSLHAVNAASDYVCGEMETYKSRYKRRKKMRSNPLYIEPSEKAVGVRVEMIFDKSAGEERPCLIQSSLQYVSIIETLKSFFACPENREMYVKYQEDHRCDSNTFGCFRCGDLFKQSPFFQENPYAIQFQFATDDLEICTALGSKSNTHKVCAVYMVIKNLPSKYLSRLQNIYLVALCNADDLKTKTTDFNNILELIVSEVKYLEETGITLDDGRQLKGTIINLMADNMGFNLALALAGHSASHFCRICELPKESCQQATAEILLTYRSSQSYQRQLDIIDNSDGKFSFKDTCGVVRYCKLNDLSHYNIFENLSVDIMHDLTEGVIPLVLKHVLEHCLNASIFKIDDVKKMIAFYSYPKEFRRSKPSPLSLTRQHLGQNSSQMKCLMLNLPFILYQYQNNIAFCKVWICVQQMIRIFQMVHTMRFKKSMKNELERLISEFLVNVKEIYQIALTPKLHYLTHYATILEKMGSLALMSMMRYEAKHCELKKIALRTKNFININKTIAISHQENMCVKGNNFKDNFSYSKRQKICVSFLKQCVVLGCIKLYPNKSFEIGCMKYNSFTFEREKVFTHESSLYKIEIVLELDSVIYFASQELDFLGIDSFTQSVMVKCSSDQQFTLIKFDMIAHKKSYPIKCIDDKNFVIIDDLELMYDM